MCKRYRGEKCYCCLTIWVIQHILCGYSKIRGKGKFNSFLSSLVVPRSSGQKEDMSWFKIKQRIHTWCEELTHLKRPWCWERLKTKEESDRGWHVWIPSQTQRTWIWANSRRWWRVGKPGMLQFKGLQRVGHDLVTQQQQYTGGPWGSRESDMTKQQIVRAHPWGSKESDMTKQQIVHAHTILTGH